MSRITLVGGGKIGEALISGLLSSGTPPQDVVVVETDTDRVRYLREKYSVHTSELAIASEGADVIVVAVKPPDVPALVARIGEHISDSVRESVLVSLAAGVPTEILETSLSAGSPVVRVMPNTAMLVGEGTSAISPGRYARDEHVDLVVDMMKTVGRTVVLPESNMDALTAISGSGPAYFFLLAEAMIDAAVQQGLPRQLATELATSTARGAGVMLAEGHDDPVALRAAVSSPGGTTASAIRQLEQGGLRAAVYSAVESAASRSREMSEIAVQAAEVDRTDEE